MTTQKTKKATTREDASTGNPIHPLRQKQGKLHKVRAKINRALSAQSRLQNVIRSEAATFRRARTRTLIACGGLLKISGLLEICQIQEGEDMQFDFEAYDKAAVLLGILLDAVAAIPNPPDAGEMETWRESGTQLLKQRVAQMTYQKRRKILQK
jgi:hypothetical protein